MGIRNGFAKKYPVLWGCEDGKKVIEVLGEEKAQFFEKTLEDWEAGRIVFDLEELEFLHVSDELFSGYAILWSLGVIGTEDFLSEYRKPEVEECLEELLSDEAVVDLVTRENVGFLEDE